MWKGTDSQEVGLDLTGLSSEPKLGVHNFVMRGRGAFRKPLKVD